jgi:integrase
VSVEKRGDKWLARVSRQIGGKQKETAKRFRLKSDAERWGREQKGRIERGRFVRPSRQAVNGYLEHWLTTLHDVGGRTREDYANITRRYLLPALGSYRLDPMTTPLVREQLAGLSARRLAPRTVAYAHAVLRRALNGAVADGLLLTNPAIGQRMLPAPARREQRVLSAPQVRLILEQTREDAHGALWAGCLRRAYGRARRWH